MEVKSVDLDIRTQILSEYVPFREWFKAAPVCVDGRHGSCQPQSVSPIYPQVLGGSLLAGVIWSMQNHSDKLQTDMVSAIQHLSDKGFPAGVHRGSHRSETASDCGFADNLGKILGRLSEDADEIRDLIESSAPSVMDRAIWSVVISDAATLSSKVSSHGEKIISDVAEKCHAQMQTLEGDHAEVAAIVNLIPDTTLDTGSLVPAGRQVFNPDLWYLLEQTKALEIDSSYSTLAALGLYLATEMVLVEDKKNYRLPVVIRS